MITQAHGNVIKMKIPNKNKLKKQNIKKKPVMKPKKEQVHIVAHEIKFARLLSGNEKKTRDRALKTLKKWLLNCFEKGYEFKENDFMRIWKGLFYAVWMSDKPLVQEEQCDNIAGILDLFPPNQYKYALLMVRVGLQAMATEWYGIDHHRMDKCLMLVRRYLRASLRCVARNGWSDDACESYARMLSDKHGIMALKTPAYARNAISMILHVIDCYLEEISKVSKGKIPPNSLVQLLKPFCAYMCCGENQTVCAASRKMLTALLRQSEAGLEYQDKTRAWEQMGCPKGGPDALQQVSDDEEETNEIEPDDRETPLDPRAGKVHVILTPLPVPAAALADLLASMKDQAIGKAHKRISITIQRFRQLSANEYPFKVEEVSLDGGKLPAARKAAKSLLALEKQLVISSDELALRGLSRKHRKRLVGLARAGRSIVEAAATNTAAGDWQVEETNQEPKKKKKQDSSNKENLNKKRKKRTSQPQQDVAAKKRKIDDHNDNTDLTKIKKKAKSDPKLNGIQKPNKPNSDKSVEHKKALEVTPKKSKLASSTGKLQTKISAEKKSILKTSIKKQKISPTVVSKKVKNFQKQLSSKESSSIHSPKKVKFVLKNNSMQGTVDYYKSVRQSPNIPFDSSRTPSKTNLKPSTPSPINPFFKKKWRLNN